MRNFLLVSLLTSMLVLAVTSLVPADTNGATPNQTLQFKCPAFVNVGITNRPADWTSYDRKELFQKTHINNQAGAITCEYGGDNTLVRFVPGYICEALGATSPAVTCSKKPKTPIKIKP